MPHYDGAAVLHATDIKFGPSPGAMNVFCTSEATDLQRSYPVAFEQTTNLTTFMQRDIVNADLGYMVNGGFSDLMKNWTVEDDQFVVKVEVQLQDTANTANGSEHDMQLSVKIGDVYVVGKCRQWTNHFEIFSCGSGAQATQVEGRCLTSSSSHEVQKKGQNRPKLFKQTWLHMQFGP